MTEHAVDDDLPRLWNHLVDESMLPRNSPGKHSRQFSDQFLAGRGNTVRVLLEFVEHLIDL